ncbi:MAG TPA: winged helix-turn-helix domain-containing protein [candidate division Zixibacteria bacterium]|nr:winged helix-turn-helix domain-containing protein [candidate division Zixibacteria bacterium]
MLSPSEPLEDTLCSRVRLRILKLLMESQTLTTAQIAEKVQVNYVVARTHLDVLEKGDILAHINFGKRIRYYRLKESAKADAVRRFIEAWQGPGNHT